MDRPPEGSSAAGRKEGAMGIHEGHRDRMKQEFLQGGLAHVSEPRVL